MAGLNENRLVREVDKARWRGMSQRPGDFTAALSIEIHPCKWQPISGPWRCVMWASYSVGTASSDPGPSSWGSMVSMGPSSGAHPRCKLAMKTQGARGWWCVGILWGCCDSDPPELPAASLPVSPHPPPPRLPGQEAVPSWAPNAGGFGALIS